MKDIASARAWLHCIGPEADLPADEVTAALQHAGVSITPLERQPHTIPGVVLCHTVTPAVCDLVRTYAHAGRARILVVVAHAQPAQAAFWQLLAAGAADVLAWHRLPDPASMILSRLQRWHVVDEIVASSRVRDELVGESPAWTALLRQVVEVGHFTDSSVLLVGETGTGKELVAHLIHELSPPRHSSKFVILDCTTIVPDLSGTELFGHERGAFTGAVAAHDGAFAAADGGTLFLDEVEELPLGLQAQLLRVLQEHTYKRVGSNTWHRTDFRLVCASNRDLLEEQAQGRFRRDLYYRLAGWVFRLPSLAERTEDILPLTRHFIAQIHPDQDLVELDAPVQEYLTQRRYPGNIRDLRNLIQRIAHRHVGDGPITIGDIPADERLLPTAAELVRSDLRREGLCEPGESPPEQAWLEGFQTAASQAVQCGAGLRAVRHAAEEAAILAAYEHEGRSWSRAAQRLGVTERTLQLRRKEHNPAPDALPA